MQVNSRVFWRSRKPDRQGNLLRPAKIVQRNGNKYRIVFLEKRLFEDSYGPVLRWVSASSLSPRIVPLASLNEPMSIFHKGFNLTCRTNACVLPGIGTNVKHSALVDGYEVGSQTTTAELAVELAYNSLVEGTYESALRLNLSVYQKWLEDGVVGADRDIAISGIKEIDQRLNKLKLLEMLFTPEELIPEAVNI